MQHILSVPHVSIDIYIHTHAYVCMTFVIKLHPSITSNIRKKHTTALPVFCPTACLSEYSGEDPYFSVLWCRHRVRIWAYVYLRAAPWGGYVGGYRIPRKLHICWLYRLYYIFKRCPSIQACEIGQRQKEKYSRTSNNGHWREIQILSVIGGVR
jgi:hypothetical protein